MSLTLALPRAVSFACQRQSLPKDSIHFLTSAPKVQGQDGVSQIKGKTYQLPKLANGTTATAVAAANCHVDVGRVINFDK